MKIGIFLEGSPKMGGGFFQSLKSSHLIFDIKKYQSSLELIATDVNTSFYFSKKNFSKKLYIPNILNRYFSELFEIDNLKDIFNKLKIIHPFTKFIKKNRYDLIIFLGPSKMAKYCGGINFVANIWDLDHKKNSLFPEHTFNHNYENKEKLIKEIVYRAFKIVVAHKNNKKDIIDFYKVPEENILVQNFIPMLPSIYEKDDISKLTFSKIFNNFNLPKDKKIIFYPAQFWPHKNHKYIIDAAKKLIQNKEFRYHFVFCGGKKGNFNFINDLIKKEKLQKHISIFNFLKDEEIISLYLNSNAVVMPTYCGPTNLPIYESFYFKKIIFYTKNLIKDDLINDHLIQIDLSSPEDFCKKLEICFDLQKIKEITEDNFKYYNSVCSEDTFKDNYQNILDNFFYLTKRWKN